MSLALDPAADAHDAAGTPVATLAPANRWLALAVLCAGVLMIALDMTIVNVALPSIRSDLRFDDSALAWVVNAYLVTFGGFLLLGGRLGDLYGNRRLFLIGLALFTAASLACGLAHSQDALIAARAVQGFGGATVDAVALSLIVELFPASGDRARAMGVYGFVCAGGGSLGAMLGGLLTGALDWHWTFLVNLPIGLVVFAFSLRLLPRARAALARRDLDVAGALTVTLALMLAVYAVVGANDAGWTSTRTLALGAVSAVLLAAFVAIESRVRMPLMPLGLFRLRNLAVANIVGVLWAAAMFAWFFMSALYVQLVLGYTPLQVGLAFLPSNLIMAAFSLGLSARMVARYGIRGPMVWGLLLAAAGLALFARAPVDGTFWIDVFPGMALLGLGSGIAFNPVLLAAMNDVKPDDSGLASGIVNTSFMMGGALGLAMLASLAAARTGALGGAGHALPQALTAGYHLAFALGTGCALLAAALGAALIRVPQNGADDEIAHAPAP